MNDRSWRKQTFAADVTAETLFSNLLQVSQIAADYCVSGIHVRDELALEHGDHVLKQQLALLESADAELVHHGVVLQAIDQVVEISVTYPEFTQSLEFCKRLSIDLVGHQAMLLAVRQ